MGKRSGNRFFTDAEIQSLLRAVGAKARRGTVRDKADQTLVVFAWATGCRAGEIASVSIDPSLPNHIDLDAGVVVIGKGKWESSGVVPLDAACLRVLRRYIRDVRPRLRNADHLDTLFITRTGSAYTPNTMSKKVSMLLTRFGYAEKSAHSFRHYLATDLMRRGVNLAIASSLLRHRDPRSTMAYSHPTADDMRRALSRRAGRTDAG